MPSQKLPIEPFRLSIPISRRGLITGAAGAASALAISATLGGPAAAAFGGDSPRRWGVWQPGAPIHMDKLLRVTQTAGEKPAAIHWFTAWGNKSGIFERSRFEKVAAYGALPVVTWEPQRLRRGLVQPDYTPRKIADGEFDDYVKTWARGLRDFGQTVLLRFGHEMNHPHFPWAVGVGGNTAQDYVDAWRHLRQVFWAEDCFNVSWVWAPQAEYYGTTPFHQVYPGHDYVDWVGMTGFNGGNELDWGGWRSFRDIFFSSYHKLETYNKPMAVCEVGSAEGGGNKAQWILEAMKDVIPNQMSKIYLLLWFNEVAQADWRIYSSRASAYAFRSAVEVWQGASGTTSPSLADIEARFK
ncbi:MAG: glycosyl hydrolase [Dehalococcoidia bacterium]